MPIHAATRSMLGAHGVRTLRRGARSGNRAARGARQPRRARRARAAQLRRARDDRALVGARVRRSAPHRARLRTVLDDPAQHEFLERSLASSRGPMGRRCVAPSTVLGRIPGFRPRDPPRVRSDVRARTASTSSSRPTTTTTSAATRSTASPTSSRAVRRGRGSPAQCIHGRVVSRPALRRGRGVRRPARRAGDRPAATRVRRAGPLTARPHGHARRGDAGLVASAPVIKYLGSKRRLVPVLGDMCAAAGARRALDLFTGTTRVAQEFKRRGADTTAVDNARYAYEFARCYIELDAAPCGHVRARRRARGSHRAARHRRLRHRDVLSPVALLPGAQRPAHRRDARRHRT